MLLASNLVLWAIVLLMTFLLLGVLHTQARHGWRLDQLEAVTPTSLGRSGIREGSRAPDFSCPTVEGPTTGLRGHPSDKVLLVFMQIGCGPCERIVPALNRLHQDSGYRVLVVNNGDPARVREWAETVRARFPVLIQERHEISRRYQVFATPFAFLLNEDRVVVSKGFVTRKPHLDFVLASDPNAPPHGSGHAIMN
jgi:methylamine dehydrogenase accessory protein MauD